MRADAEIGYSLETHWPGDLAVCLPEWVWREVAATLLENLAQVQDAHEKGLATPQSHDLRAALEQAGRQIDTALGVEEDAPPKP
jgi:hypothetical protein